MTAPEPHRHYLLRSAIACIGACALAAAINLAVDPYGIFGAPRIDGFNAVKPAVGDRVRYVKGYHADRIEARTLIGGNSRPEIGLDPASHCWTAAQQPVFNVAIPGTSLAQQIQFIEHAAAGGSVQRVLLGLDLVDFFVDPRGDPSDLGRPNPGGPDALNLRVDQAGAPSQGYRKRRLVDWLTALFSLETLGDSLATLLRQAPGGTPDRRADGFNPADDYWPIIRAEGQAVLFDQKNREIMGLLGRSSGTIYQGSRRWSSTFETLARFLDRAQERGVKVILFINPYHADYLAAIGIEGRWHILEDWKRTLVSLTDARGLVLWDFNAFSPRTTEPPPPLGDQSSSLQWFWEPSHYRREYGESMLSAMLERDCAAMGVEPVGIRLSGATTEAHLRSLRDALNVHIAANPATVQRLEDARPSR